MLLITVCQIAFEIVAHEIDVDGKFGFFLNLHCVVYFHWRWKVWFAHCIASGKFAIKICAHNIYFRQQQ